MPSFLRRPATWITLLVLIVLGSIGFVMLNAAKQKQAAQAAAHAEAPTPFSAVAEGKADVEGGIIQVAARTAGVVREVDVLEGDMVVKNQILARQEEDTERLAVETAEASLKQAKAVMLLTQSQLQAAHREAARMNSLKGVVPTQQIDQAGDTTRNDEATLASQQAAVTVAQAQLDEARYRLEQTTIRAPVNGRIVRRYANPGTGASTLNVTPMFDLEPSGQRIVRAEVSESALPFVGVGGAVQMVPESDQSKAFTGRVLRRAAVFGARKLQSDDPSERTDERVVEVVISADGAPFLIGQRVLVKFLKPGFAANAKAPAVAGVAG
jgi:multidrug resistance efflux pump